MCFFISVHLAFHIILNKKGPGIYDFYSNKFQTAAQRHQIKTFENGFREHAKFIEVKIIP